MMTIQTMVDAVNAVCSPLHRGEMPLEYQAVSATTWDNLEAIGEYFRHTPVERKDLKYPDQDVVCLMGFSWGHTKWADSSRKQNQDHLDKVGRTGTPGKWLISVNELAMSLQNHNLWLNASDHDWHRPLITVIRAYTQKNAKFQGQLTEKQRVNQERFAPRRKKTAYTGEEGSEETEEKDPQVPWRTKEHSTWQRYEDKARKDWDGYWDWSKTTTTNSASSSSTGNTGALRPSLDAPRAPWRKDEKQDDDENITWGKHKY
jgi:hypothetical protein